MKQYLTREEAAEDINVSKREIANIITGIRENMGPGKRYGQYSLRGSGRLTQIRYAVLTDYMRYKDYFSDSVLAENIPQFNAREAERDLGVVSDSFRDPAAQIDADMIAEAIIKAFALKMAQ